MEKTRVVVLKCDDYEEEKVYSLMKKGLEKIGGVEKYIGKDEKILVKPNFLYPSKREKRVTTDPSVITGMLRILNEEGFTNVKVGDSPASGTSKQALKDLDIDEHNLYGAVPALMNEEVKCVYEDGRKKTTFYLTKDVYEADAIIGLSKMKTHMLERLTGAVKNMYGLICGFRKAQGHVSYPNAVLFAKMMAALHKYTKPRFHIMDGVYAMEGNGPASGTERKMGVLLVSSDPVAIDSVFSRLVDMKPTLVPTNVWAYQAGVGTYKEDEIEVLLIDEDGENTVSFDELFKKYGCPDFDCEREKEKLNVLTLWGKLTKKVVERPVIDQNKCVKCGQCVEHCPVEGKAVTFRNGKDNTPVYNYDKCIRCYCCQEICPMHAISVKKR
ncbi:MAG: DUF362 domain-containing protein [Clostridia bacterium]|nr:DUF362 domain-containing protein [Clostridia bacterium]